MKVCFICYGNICRSPVAALIFNNLAKNKSDDDSWQVVSGGISPINNGRPADKRMIKLAEEHGLDLTKHIARQISDDDIITSDILIIMDKLNQKAISDLEIKYPGIGKKTFLLRLFDKERKAENEVPDPYYFDYEVFIDVYNIIERSCNELIKYKSAAEIEKALNNEQ